MVEREKVGEKRGWTFKPKVVGLRSGLAYSCQKMLYTPCFKWRRRGQLLTKNGLVPIMVPRNIVRILPGVAKLEYRQNRCSFPG